MIRLVRLTPPGRSAVAGLALVGDGAAELAGRFFRGNPLSEDGVVRVGLVAGADGPIDRVVAVRRSGGRVEIFCHGGTASAGRIASLFTGAGASAEGEGDALEGGDAIRREALTLLPEALTERVARMLLSQEEGVLARRTRDIAGQLAVGDAQAAGELARMHETFRAGRALLVPARVVIAGPPNAGKSTLLNRLYGETRAVVSSEAGTTRDPVEALIEVAGVPLRVADTAGLGAARDVLDAESQSRARDRIRGADLVLALFDGSARDFPFSLPPVEWAWLDPARTLWIRNKSDLASRPPESGWLPVSALTGEGIDALGGEIVRKIAGNLPTPGEPCLFTERQAEIVRRARDLAAFGAFSAAARVMEELA